MKKEVNFDSLFFLFLEKYDEEIKQYFKNKASKIQFEDMFKNCIEAKVARLSTDVVNSKIHEIITNKFKDKLNKIFNEKINEYEKQINNKVEYFIFSLLGSEETESFFDYEWDENFSRKLRILINKLNGEF